MRIGIRENEKIVSRIPFLVFLCIVCLMDYLQIDKAEIRYTPVRRMRHPIQFNLTQFNLI